MTSARWITEAEVVGLISLEEALEPLADGLRRLDSEGGVTIPKAMHAWAGGSMHALGAYDPVSGLSCFKCWINTPQGAVALLTLFDVSSGTLRAVIEAGALGSMRTSGVTGLATRTMADPDATEATILGSGRQALSQLAAIALVRPLSTVRFWSPTAEKREAAAKMATERFGIRAHAVDTLEEALSDSPIIASVTRAKDPIISASMLARGAHLNAVGAILPGFAEIDPDVLESADLIIADSVAGVSQLREMKDAVERDPSVEDKIFSISAMLAGSAASRPTDVRLTVFKSVGIGASDLAIAGEVLRRAEAGGVGRPIDNPSPTPPRWRAN